MRRDEVAASKDIAPRINHDNETKGNRGHLEERALKEVTA
jgi:hypothetical protein